MPSQRDIYATAKLLVDRHGLDGARDHCRDRVEALTAEGDTMGAHVWDQVRLALLDLSPAPGGPIN